MSALAVGWLQRNVLDGFQWHHMGSMFCDILSGCGVGKWDFLYVRGSVYELFCSEIRLQVALKCVLDRRGSLHPV